MPRLSLRFSRSHLFYRALSKIGISGKDTHQEQNKLRLCEQLGRTDGPPEEGRVLEAADARVLVEALIKTRDRT